MFKPVQTVAPTVKPVTLAEAKAWLWVDHSSHDALIAGLISAAVAHLDGWSGILGRCLINQTWRQAWTVWEDELRLPFPNVSAVTLTYYDQNNVQQTVAASAYELIEDAMGSLIRFNSTFDPPELYEDRTDAVRCSLVAGYGTAASDVPESLKVAIKMLVAQWYANREVSGPQSFAVPLGFDAIVSPFKKIGM
jgi:uncharacterized phiE125 gp8 family phage protein